MMTRRFSRLGIGTPGRPVLPLRRAVWLVAMLMAISTAAPTMGGLATRPTDPAGLVLRYPRRTVEPRDRLAGVAVMGATVNQARTIKSGVRAVTVPKDPNWAKYVLLVVIWTLVIAAVIGPMQRFIRRQHLPPDILKSRGW
ncbi:MAG: hypothetical protein ACP5I8_11200 [Phycisphaerae bacterium]